MPLTKPFNKRNWKKKTKCLKKNIYSKKKKTSSFSMINTEKKKVHNHWDPAAFFLIHHFHLQVPVLLII